MRGLSRGGWQRSLPQAPDPASSGDEDILALVRRAVAERSAMLAFQPVMQADRPDAVAFQEGLVRIRDSAGRPVPAGLFIDAVEGCELGRQIDCLALELGLAALDRHPGLRLSVNVSALSLGHAGWLRTLDSGLRGAPTAGERLILEITETSVMEEPEAVASLMGALRRRGVAFALDDFGAGVTSFRHLREFRFDIVKIDGQFVQGVARNRDNAVLISALVTIARHFEMLTVAERVETAEDAAASAALGVNCLQGYLFGAPTLSPEWQASGRLTA
jgi:EAL domain-containing protein (putative c-di-GMP-specific phosphodiesterase class I)